MKRATVADRRAPDEQMYTLAYDELKRIARHHLRASGEATLSTTELVHEAFLKLSKTAGDGWEGEPHFFGAASRAMRQVLVDFGRRRQSTKRGGGLRRVSLSDADGNLDIELDEILALDDALKRLSAVDEKLGKLVELRFFGGLPESEVARLLGVSQRTVERNWLKARLFLLRELEAHELRTP